MMIPKRSRAQLRAIQIDEIKRVAKVQLVTKGVSGVSLREIARDLGLVSSALYRYFSTRDELLTALILDAYNELGEAVEKADASVVCDDTFGRWRAACLAIRQWASAHPHEYTLLYGTPLLDYHAPDQTIAPASRVTLVLGRIVGDAHRRRPPSAIPTGNEDVTSWLNVSNLAQALPGVPTLYYVRALIAWSEIFGFLSFELFGHFKGSIIDYEKAFSHVVEELANFVLY